jgi:hypothetical protein
MFMNGLAQKTRLHPQRGADLTCQGCSATRIAIELVVDVKGVKLDPEFGGDVFQTPKKCRGIGSTGESNQEPVACPDRNMVLEERSDLGE